MKKAVQIAVGLIAGLAVGGTMLLTTFGAANSANAKDTGFGGGIATDAPVPDWLRTLINKHAGKCPQVTASILAAQLYTESNFNAHARSPVGALGIAQFMPDTWAAYGMDGDGDGVKDVFNPADAVAAQANYDCIVAKEVKDVPGDSTDNMLAAYNAGGGAVIKYGGIPPYAETRDYVKSIRELARKWTDALTPLPAGKGAARAIAAAKTALGTWYQWGGDCVAPYTGQNGCDCSSLTKMAWASSGVNLPRTTYEQVHSGTAVQSVSQLQPGDLLFSVPGGAGPEHVGMYIGNGQVIDAPRTGSQVRIKPLSYWTPQIIAMRHVG
ncbi:bifunctional lytic transglycosylase/C40 family peptidase [Streptomyces sp. UNOC14_S4]|uniref:C40 family peptidase n=1 Tax=Streptomyces sp. UNOC14_S4 TaxID=2872340 RepID=UPI001E62884A|nr:bifunctional lytic transglycosylase/C40 family peptidase [Streptomyces sp. UNOC14_S4]MCC3767689.1 bifunctional lytic transglycosylase/C40 family peptidase [Streptomyces sp. UNOC14_S4]